MSGVLILGASHSGIAAAAALRGFGYEGALTVVSREEALPYHRPPLSKEALSAEEYSPALLRPETFYRTNRIDLERGMTIANVDTENRNAVATDGRRYEYDTLIFACGAEPRRLPLEVDPQGAAFYLRTHDDFIQLSSRMSRARTLAVIGGGLIGLEVAALAVSKGIRTTLVEAGERLMERTVSRSIAGYLLDRHRARGLEVKLASPVASIRRNDDRNTNIVSFGHGETIEADLVVAAIGIVPNDQLARRAGLSVESGILTSHQGQIEDRAIYAIGDCASWFNVDLGHHVRYEAVNPGQDQAKIVAASITGAPMPTRRAPRYWSHQAEIQIQMAGDVHKSEAEAVLKGPTSGAFSVLGLKDGRLVSVQSVNAARQFMMLQDLIGTDRDGLATALNVEFPPPRH
ncbi:NAD(P)/FAD-dependent oxidoreductase [Microvirga zambiensis]|uniref:NAD(P)/FAD-dependent oxidoreductase n=1 Tax=Microvirga zambiensis TaxID=1402137 RepID=UPI00191F233B|nr:FAD-dependent oxidoreductase [Microvirga zambiensis]